MFKFPHIKPQFLNSKSILKSQNNSKPANLSEIDIHINPDFAYNSEISIDEDNTKIGINKNMDIYLWNGVDHDRVSQAMNTKFIAHIDCDFPNITLKKITAGISRQVFENLLSRLNKAFPNKFKSTTLLYTENGKY